MGRAGARSAGARSARPRITRTEKYRARAREARAAARPQSAPGPDRDRAIRASREEPSRYLLRFGYVGDALAGLEPNPPQLSISVRGHEEDEESAYVPLTMYLINCSLSHSSIGGEGQESRPSAAAAVRPEALRRPTTAGSSRSEETEASADDAEPVYEKYGTEVPEVTVDSSSRRWTTKKRLCNLRELLHHPVKEVLGPRYAELFAETPFARHGGLPGTTARLRDWMNTLAAAVNNGELPQPLLAEVLRFLQAPVPRDSDERCRQVDSAALRAKGRCISCTLPTSDPDEEVCIRCQALRKGAAWVIKEKAEESVRSPSPRSSRVERSAPSELDVGQSSEDDDDDNADDTSTPVEAWPRSEVVDVAWAG